MKKKKKIKKIKEKKSKIKIIKEIPKEKIENNPEVKEDVEIFLPIRRKSKLEENLKKEFFVEKRKNNDEVFLKEEVREEKEIKYDPRKEETLNESYNIQRNYNVPSEKYSVVESSLPEEREKKVSLMNVSSRESSTNELRSSYIMNGEKKKFEEEKRYKTRRG